jgi:hypothetical protein
MPQVNEQQLLPDLATPEELAWLAALAKNNGYLAPLPMGNGQWVAIYQFMFTAAILKGDMFDDDSYKDRWCFSSFGKAAVALAVWTAKGFEGEPQGWHRHPDSGRRRPDGDASQEYINR